jgi:hypothetical protein
MKKVFVLLSCLVLNSALHADILYNCVDGEGAGQTMTFLKSDTNSKSVFSYATKEKEISFEFTGDKFSIVDSPFCFTVQGSLGIGGESSFKAFFPKENDGEVVSGILNITDIVGEQWIMPAYFNCQISQAISKN